VGLTCEESEEDESSLSALGTFVASVEGYGGAFAGALATVKKSKGRSTLPTL